MVADTMSEESGILGLNEPQCPLVYPFIQQITNSIQQIREVVPMPQQPDRPGVVVNNLNCTVGHDTECIFWLLLDNSRP